MTTAEWLCAVIMVAAFGVAKWCFHLDSRGFHVGAILCALGWVALLLIEPAGWAWYIAAVTACVALAYGLVRIADAIFAWRMRRYHRKYGSGNVVYPPAKPTKR